MYSVKANERLVEVVSKFSGLPEKTIKRYGIRSVFQTPWAVKGMTNERKQRLEMLQEFMSLWTEMSFVNEEVFLTGEEKAGEFFMNRLSHKCDKEYFEIAYLDCRNKIIEIETIEGTLSSVQVYPREIVKSILAYNAAAVVLAHTHPGGSLHYTWGDQNITQKIIDAARVIDVTVLDHIIITNRAYYSFRANGVLINW